MPRKNRDADKTFDALIAELDPVEVTTTGPQAVHNDGDQDVEADDRLLELDGVGPATFAAFTETKADDLVRTARGAIEWARDVSQRNVAIFAGLCLMFVRSCFNVGPLYPDAWTAWLEADRRNRCTPNDAPRGRAGFFRGGLHGHVVLTLGKGLCYSSDVKRKGMVDVCRIADIEKAWGYTFVGTTGDLNGESPVPRQKASRRRLTDRQWRIRFLRRALLRARSQGEVERARRVRRWLDALRAS